VTCNPSEDKRNAVQGTDSKGLLARGTILFSQSSGDILDLTMSKFTGRIGNFQANGVNTNDSIHYEILNQDEFAKDGYGFQFEYDGSAWDFVDANNNGIIEVTEKPDNYPNATIVYSDNQQVHLVLNQTSPTDTDPDLKIRFDQPAVATDSFGFDINDPNDLHLQGIDGTRYFGDTANDNTTLEINDPSVMTHDSSGLGIIWNPNTGGTGKWHWSNPELALSAGTLVSGPVITNATGGTNPTTAATAVVNNASDLSMVAQDIRMYFDGTDWDWNDGVKAEDFTSTYSFNPTNDPVLSILTSGTQGAIATNTALTTPTLTWLGDHWSLSSAASVSSAVIGNTYMDINTTASDNTKVVFDIYYGAGNSGGASTVQYSFGSAITTASGQTIDFLMDPTPPQEYAAAVVTHSTAAVETFSIDFDGDNIQDLTMTPTAGGVASTAGASMLYTIDPDVPPTEYANATLKGDQEAAIIDLDGSGNDDDNDDIKFLFSSPLKFGASTHPYNDRSEIDFNILGATSWTEVDKTEIEQSGYFSFVADFLGGEYGSTETDISLDLGTVYQNNTFVNGSLSTTQYSKSSSTVFQDANGYAAGDLQGVDVSSDGVMTGIYSNGQLIPLFRVGLAKFLNNYGLSNEGGNLFSETRASGGAITNKPGENGLGTIAPNSLEMSNVDISEEFVNMITNQRGFQANSKTITTVDDMMTTVIQMKR
jgi:flagellar hook protein FlgE